MILSKISLCPQREVTLKRFCGYTCIYKDTVRLNSVWIRETVPLRSMGFTSEGNDYVLIAGMNTGEDNFD
jgi:hypothetical protein